MPQPPEGMPPPICLALVLADAIHSDPATDKLTILGTFSSIWAQTFPSAPITIAVYGVLTEGYGQRKITIRFVKTADDSIVAQAGQDCDFADPRVVVDIQAKFVGLVFPEPGEYCVQILSGDDILIERRLTAGVAATEGGNDDAS